MKDFVYLNLHWNNHIHVGSMIDTLEIMTESKKSNMWTDQKATSLDTILAYGTEV